MTFIDKQANWLLKVKKLTEHPIMTSNTWQKTGKPGRWRSLSQAQYPIDYRSVLPYELVFDIDGKTYPPNKEAAEYLISWLSQNEIPYIMADSGGKGLHIHVFMDISESKAVRGLLEKIRPKDEHSLIREVLFDYILQEAIPQNRHDLKEILDKKPVRWSIESKGRLIREFGGLKYERNDYYYKTLLTKLPDKQKHRERQEKNVKFPGEIETWKVPEKLLVDLLKPIADRAEKKRERRGSPDIEDMEYDGNYLNLPCVRTALLGMEEGKRNKGAILIAAAAGLDGKTEDEVRTILEGYRQRCEEGEHIFDPEELEGPVKWSSKVRGWWLCKHAGELKICDKPSCGLISTFKRKRSSEAKKQFDEGWKKAEKMLRDKGYPQKLVDGLKAHYTIIYSLKLREFGEIVNWLWYIDEPSGLKTWIIRMVSKHELGNIQDEFTPASFVAGKVDEESGKAHDLLPELNNKILYTKDLTPLFSLHPEKIVAILGIFTRLYDGEGYSRSTAMRGTVSYPDMMFGWIGAATNMAVESNKKSIQKLGPRVLFWRFDFKRDEIKHMRKHRLSGEESRKLQEILSGLSNLCLECEPIKIEFSDKEDDLLGTASDLLAKVRGIVSLKKEWVIDDGEDGGERKRSIEYLQVDQEEYPLRAYEQLRSLVIAYMTLFNSDFEEALGFAVRIVIYSAPPKRSKALQLFLAGGAIQYTTIKESLGISEKGADRMLEELKLLGLIEENVGGWYITENFRELFDLVYNHTVENYDTTQTTYPTSNQGREESDKAIEYVNVRVIKIPDVKSEYREFAGVDGKTYKIKKENQVLTLPELNANNLIENGYAIKISEEDWSSKLDPDKLEDLGDLEENDSEGD